MHVLRMYDLDLAGKRVFIRADFNGPQDESGDDAGRTNYPS